MFDPRTSSNRPKPRLIVEIQIRKAEVCLLEKSQFKILEGNCLA